MQNNINIFMNSTNLIKISHLICKRNINKFSFKYNTIHIYIFGPDCIPYINHPLDELSLSTSIFIP